MLSDERISRVVQHYQHSPDQACDLLLQLPRGKFAPPASSPWSAYTVHLKVLLCVLLAAVVLRASWVYLTYTTNVFVVVFTAVVALIVPIFELVDQHNAEKRHREQMKEHTHFYQKDDLESLSQRSRSSESPMDQEAMGAEMAVFLQKWVNADPKEPQPPRPVSSHTPTPSRNIRPSSSCAGRNRVVREQPGRYR